MTNKTSFTKDCHIFKQTWLWINSFFLNAMDLIYSIPLDWAHNASSSGVPFKYDSMTNKLFTGSWPTLDPFFLAWWASSTPYTFGSKTVSPGIQRAPCAWRFRHGSILYSSGTGSSNTFLTPLACDAALSAASLGTWNIPVTYWQEYSGVLNGQRAQWEEKWQDWQTRTNTSPPPPHTHTHTGEEHKQTCKFAWKCR